MRSKKQRPCQDLEEVCYWQAVWLPSLCVGVCFHDFCNCPFIGETYTYDWQLITHPKDYSGEMEGKHSQILKLSKVNLPPVIFRAGVEVLTISQNVYCWIFCPHLSREQSFGTESSKSVTG